MVLTKLQQILKPSRIASSIERGYRWLLATTLLAVVYRFCWIDASDPFKCGALLHKGEWLDAGSDPSTNYQKWQPPGCLIHDYKGKDVQECLSGRRLLFAGDSITRQIFWAVANKLDHEGTSIRTVETPEMDHKHEDMSFMSNGITLDFLWDPYLNTSALDHELRSFNVNSVGTGAGASPALILLGAPGLWYARSEQENYMREFRDSIDRIIPFMDHLPGNISMPDVLVKPPTSPNILLLAPIQVPKYELLSSSREETITPEKIDQMNDYLQQTSAYSSADVLWSYSRMTSSGSHEYLEDGLHVTENVAVRKADILLNLRCNNDAARNGPPFDKTCCSDYGQTYGFQLAILFVGMVVFPILFIIRQKNTHKLVALMPGLENLKALKVLGLVICFCYFTDRTQLFEKAPKRYHLNSLAIPCFVAGFLGLVCLQKSKPPTINQKSAVAPQAASHGILSREQTDEWKGWMQAIILVYHFTYGSQILWLYEIVRLLVASYLFMTGFGHALFFLQKQDYSMKRVCSILVKVNLLSCVLPYIMRTDYLFYYFAPLVTFWFIVVLITLRIGYERNDDLKFLFGKILCSCIFTTACTKVSGFWECFALLLHYTCKIAWDSQEWRFRLQLDMYIVYVGMIIAILVHRTSKIQQSLLVPTSQIDNVLALILAQGRAFKIAATVFSTLFICAFWILRGQFSEKKDYNSWQPYLSIIPVLGFVALRNSLQVFRNYHSTAFAWLGRCSLETYILQYHLWLAADTKALLRIGMWNEKFETVLLTVLFLWISHLTMSATRVLTAWIVGGTVSPMGRISQYSNDPTHGKDSPRLLPSIESRSRRPKGPPEKLDEEHGRLGPKLRMGLLVFGLWLCNILSQW